MRPQQVAAGCAQSREIAQARVRHRLRSEPRARVRGHARQRHGRLAAERGDRGVRRRRRRRDRLRAGRRAPRSSARVRPRPGRLQLLVQLLRDPGRARGVPQPERRGGSPGGAEASGQGHREVVLTGINLGCFRDREAATRWRDSCARPGRRPAWTGCGFPRSRSTTSATSSFARCVKRRPSRDTCTSRSSRVTMACSRRWAVATPRRRTCAASGRSRIST